MEYLSEIKPVQTVCFTGHRPDRLPRDATACARMLYLLDNEIKLAICRGKVNFVSGAMSGFDIIAAERVITHKAEYSQLRCILILPFSVRYFENENWTPEWIDRLQAVSEQADYEISLFERYHYGVYYERDKFIVDMSSEVIAYFDGQPGGTKYTIDYTVSCGKPLINLADAFAPI
ncbi:MAG: DUF1273 domain-containing protein [Firmicutes bacterium]|nr:DUF1273 domain-containing protein [Bacillota bacterium]